MWEVFNAVCDIIAGVSLMGVGFLLSFAASGRKNYQTSILHEELKAHHNSPNVVGLEVGNCAGPNAGFRDWLAWKIRDFSDYLQKRDGHSVYVEFIGVDDWEIRQNAMKVGAQKMSDVIQELTTYEAIDKRIEEGGYRALRIEIPKKGTTDGAE